MKRLIQKRSIFCFVCALLLALALFVPNTVEAASLTVYANSPMEYTAGATGETLNVTLYGTSGNVILKSSPLWTSCSKGGSPVTISVQANSDGKNRSGSVVYQDGNKTYTLQISQKAQTVNVRFDLNGGNGPSLGYKNRDYTVGTKYDSLPVDPTAPSGYSFAGWFTDAQKGDKITETSIVDAKVKTLYAHYFPKQYKVSFDTGGVSSVQSKWVAYKDKYGTLSTPKSGSYVFQGWYTKASGGDLVDSNTIMKRTMDHTLYAHWKKVTVSFNINGGSGSINSKAYTIGSTYGSLPAGPTPPDSGHEFGGWYTAATGGTKVTSGSTVSANVSTLYAHYEPKKLTVTFKDGNTVVKTKTVTYGNTYGTLPTRTKTGYEDAKWFTSASGGNPVTDSTKVTITSDQTLYARWTPRRYTVSFNSQGGSSVSSKTVSYDSTYGTLSKPTKSGYTFAGWYTAASSGSPVTSDTKVKITGDQTLYARWTPKTFTVTFKVGDTKVSTKDVTYGSTYGSLPNRTISGTGSSSRKARWFTKQKPGEGTEITAATKVTITGPQTLYAKWEMLVMFDINGGRDSNTSQAYLIGEVFEKLPSDPTPPNSSCRFDGWYTKAVGGTKITTTTTVTSSHTKLYAHYVVDVKFDTNGGSGNIQNRTYVFGDKYGNLPAGPTRDNYEFVGWRTGKDSGVMISNDMTVSAPISNTLYASWRLKNPKGYADPHNEKPLQGNDKLAYNFNSYPVIPGMGKNYKGYYIEFKTTDAPPATYWALCAWDMRLRSEGFDNKFGNPYHGYAGFQVSKDGIKQLIFTMWDGTIGDPTIEENHHYVTFVNSDFAKDKYTCNDVPESKEGSYSRYLFDYNWSPNKWYGMYISYNNTSSYETCVSVDLLDVSASKWIHVITVKTPLKRSYLTGSMYSFMENYKSAYRERRRSCMLRNAHILQAGLDWEEITSFTLKTDTSGTASNKVGSFAFNTYSNYIWAYTSGAGPNTYGGRDKYNISFPASVKSGGKLPELPTN